MKIRFLKYSGAGNDFILIDNRDNHFETSLVPSLCHRQEGIGADGVILLSSCDQDIYKMHIYNADGSIAEMCGNGIRCFTKFLGDLGFIQNRYIIENIEHKIFETFLSSKDEVVVKMASVSDVCFNKICLINDQSLLLHSLNTGVPHAVFFTPHIETMDVQTMGRHIRYHKDYQPKGTNANFACLDEHGILHVRTYERGVENETLACGTGACASAIAAAKIYHLKAPIKVKVRSNSLLTINFQQKKDTFFDLTLEGPAKKVFEGSFFIL